LSKILIRQLAGQKFWKQVAYQAHNLSVYSIIYDRKNKKGRPFVDYTAILRTSYVLGAQFSNISAGVPPIVELALLRKFA